MEYRWGGRLCLSWNTVPAFGEVEKNLYSACCQNGLGTALGTSSGMLIADLAIGNTSNLLGIMQKQASPKKDTTKTIVIISVLMPAYVGVNFEAGREL